MKKIVLAGLLATTLITPITSAMAQDNDRQGRWSQRDDDNQPANRGRGNGWHNGQTQQTQRQEAQSDPRGQRGRDNNGQAEGRRGNDAQAQAQQAQAQVRQQAQIQQQAPRGGYEGRFDNGRTYRDQTRAPVPQAQVRPDGRIQQDWRGQASNDRRDDARRRPGNDGRYDGRRLDDRQRWNSQQQWSNNWRNDRRYDWRSYRNTNRNAFHAQRYYAPYGWNYGYQRFSTGLFLSSLLFSNQYWIDDPYDYRLPPAYGTLRWIRYYDDALLVDIRDGYVVDVIHDFFW